MNENQKKLKNLLEKEKTLTVVGGNWGDEGKGKVIDLVMEHFDIVARFSGGANAGHTVYTPEGKKLVSHLIPTGLAQNKVCVMARGEFFNLELFLKELEDSKSVLGENLPAIYIDQQAPLWTPYHRLFEAYIELRRGAAKIGTTNKGIGPLEGLYKLRLAPVVGYLFEKELLLTCLESLYKVLQPCFDSEEFKALGESVPTPDQIANELLGKAQTIKEWVCDTAYLLNQHLEQGKKILLEGAQATGLDAWWGTYPFVSSGNSVAAGAALGTGLPLKEGASILVAKTLPTRVGFGPMPSEMWGRQEAMDFAKDHPNLYVKGEKRDGFLKELLAKINTGSASGAEMSKYFQVLGDERGATTGRGRSVGYLDIPWLLYAIRVNAPKWIALTRFDMLSGVLSVPVVVGYKYKGQALLPGQISPPWQMGEVEIVKENWTGFEQDISGIDDFNKFPNAAKQFIEKLEQYLEIPILLIGTGPARQAMVVKAR